MLLIHYFNMSHFKRNSQFYTEMKYFLYGETVLYVIDTLNMLLYIWVLFSAAQFHYNFNLISGAQYVIHFLDNLVILGMRIHWILGYEEEDFSPLSDPLCYWLMTISIYCITAAMCTLPFFVLERCFATFYLKDYEKNQRRHISYLLVILLNVIGAFGAVVLQNKDNTLYIVIGLVVPNVLAVTLNLFLKIWNKRKYDECQNTDFRGKGNYTLAKRFQVTENLKSLKMLHTIVFYMGFMNVLLVACVLISSLSLSPEHQAICSFILDFSIFLYSFMLPQIMTCFCKRWKTQTNVFKERIGCRRKKPSSVNPMKEARPRGNEEMDAYFDQLRSTWERE